MPEFYPPKDLFEVTVTYEVWAFSEEEAQELVLQGVWMDRRVVRED